MDKKKLKFISLVIVSVILVALFAVSAFISLFNYSYVRNYNLGNKAYKEGNLTEAVAYYTEALKFYPPEGPDCRIRINMALALCYSIDFDNLDTEDKVSDAINILNYAKSILMANGCADDQGTGHDADAQQLKEDIDKMLQKLQNQEQNQNQDQEQEQEQEQNQDDQNKDEQQSSGQSSKQQEQQKKLQEEKKSAGESRKEEQESVESYEKYTGRNATSGGSDNENGEDGNDGDGQGSQITHPW